MVIYGSTVGTSCRRNSDANLGKFSGCAFSKLSICDGVYSKHFDCETGDLPLNIHFGYATIIVCHLVGNRKENR